MAKLRPPKAKYGSDPTVVKLSPARELEFTTWLVNEIQAAYDARATIIGQHGEIDYLHWLYEQGRSPQATGRWPGAADLGSPIITEKVDALRARMVRTVLTEPIWVVEGWGKDASRAPFVEEFHQWQAENERLQAYFTKGIHNGLIEGTGILEVVDRHDLRLVTKKQQVAAKLGPDGASVLLDEDNQPIVDLDEEGRPVPVEDGKPVIDAEIASYERVRKGPGYRVISLRDFLFLPGHAADKSELFGYAKRCWKRMPDLDALAKQGVYTNVEKLSRESDRETANPNLERQGQQIAEQRDRTSEKELWEVLILHDLDDDGLEEWYVATVSVQHRLLLRLQKDDLGVPRYIDLTPFPRPDSVYGYPFAWKLASTAEEHAARRNMVSDRSTLATNAPITRRQGALWDPKEQPWGPGVVIDVRDAQEITPIQVPDIPQSAMALMQEPLQMAERIAGLNDISTAATSTEDKTLGEVRLQTTAAEIRIDEGVKLIQESLETLFLVRNELWIRTLEKQPEGIEPPDTLVRSLEARGLKDDSFNGKFTAKILRGNFRGKPRGSVETADRGRLLAMFNGSIRALAEMAKFNPLFGMILQHPGVAKTILEQWARLYAVPDRQVFMQAAQEVVKQLQEQAAQQQAMMQGGMPPQGQLPPGPPEGIDGMMAQLPPELQQLAMGAMPQ